MIIERLQYVFHKALRQLYPDRCPVCDRILYDTLICPKCMGKLKYVSQPVCYICGKPVINAGEEYCSDCVKGRHEYEQGKAVWSYEGAMRGILYRYKYSNRRDYTEFFATEAARMYGGWVREHGIEAVMPIPLARKKQRLRGYNQAEAFARRFAQLCELPLYHKRMVRTRNTIPQKQLSVTERKNNLKNAFKIREDVVKLKRVLLVDDIYTTGSTMDAATHALKKAGAEEVYCLCISIGRGQ